MDRQLEILRQIQHAAGLDPDAMLRRALRLP